MDKSRVSYLSSISLRTWVCFCIAVTYLKVHMCKYLYEGEGDDLMSGMGELEKRWKEISEREGGREGMKEGRREGREGGSE